jgi:WD40 repeat protein
MTVGRDSHTATLLQNGRVLIAGRGGYDAARSAELYDPTTGTFSRTGSMTVGRDSQTATLLQNGRVLMVGGWESTSQTNRVESASAELYDPQTGTFTPTASLPEARHFHTATRLLDGRVLVTGGETPVEGMGTATAELYDPSTGKFSPTGSMTRGRIFHTATLLRDGRVLIAGGNSDSTAELYDPGTGTFSATGSMTHVNQEHVATLLSDGRVLVAGRGTDPSGRSQAELYDPTSGAFSPTGSMSNSCACMGPIGSPGSAPLLSNGRVLVVDGGGSAELYDPASGTFSPTGSLRGDRQGFTTTLLVDGRVLVAGDTGPLYAGPAPSLSPAEIAAIDADRSSAELYVP